MSDMRRFFGTAALRLQWPVRTGIVCGLAGLLHLITGEFAISIFAVPAFAAVVATIASGPTLGCTLRFSALSTVGIVFGSLLAAATLLFWGVSSGGLVGVIFLQSFIICVPHGAFNHPERLVESSVSECGVCATRELC